MFINEFEVVVLQTRTGTITATMKIEAISQEHADKLRDGIYDAINSARNLLAPLQHITSSPKSVAMTPSRRTETPE